MDKAKIEAVVLKAMSAAGGEDAPAVFRDLPLGATGVRADLAIVADEFIGVAVRGSDDGLDGVGEELTAYARYFDRVALALPPGLVDDVRFEGRSSAAIWAVDEGGLTAVRPGHAGCASIGGYFDLLTIEERRRVLRELTGFDPSHARGAPPSMASVRGAFAAAVAARP